MTEGARLTYQVYLRIQRGGTGINYRAARDEFLAACARLQPRVVHESQARMRVLVELECPDEAELATIGSLLGYTEAIFRRRIEPYNPGLPEGEQVGRYLVGARRFGAETHIFAPLYFADEGARIAASPHEREFAYLEDGREVRGQRRHVHRRLSPCDAKLMLNVCLPLWPPSPAGMGEPEGAVPSLAQDVQSGPLPLSYSPLPAGEGGRGGRKPFAVAVSKWSRGGRILDPFAGIGGIVVEARARGLEIICGDVDPVLAPGLSEASGGLAAIWDARELPLRDSCVDAVVTEPPYHRDLAPEVYDAIPELARVVRPAGRLALLIAGEMEPPITRAALLAGLIPVARYAIRRQKMQAVLLIHRKPD